MQQKSLEQQAQALLKTHKAETDRLERLKNSLLRDISALEVKKSVAAEELEQVNGSIEAARDKLRNLELQNEAYGKELLGKNAELERLAQLYTSTQQEQEALEHGIALRKSKVDDDIAEYRKTRKLEIETSLSEKTAALEDTNHELEAAQDALRLAKEERNDILSATELDKEAHKAKILDYEKLVKELNSLETELTTKVKKLKTEVRELELLRRQTVRATEQARIEHNQFLEYEQNARNALETQDKSLQRRTQDIEQTEVMLAHYV